MEGAAHTSSAAPDVEQVSAALMKMVCGGAQQSRKLPEGEDMRYFMSVEPELRPLYEEAKQSCLSLAQKLMDLNAAGTKSRVPSISGAEDVDELLALFPAVVESSTDPLVENVVSIRPFSAAAAAGSPPLTPDPRYRSSITRAASTHCQRRL